MPRDEPLSEEARAGRSGAPRGSFLLLGVLAVLAIFVVLVRLLLGLVVDAEFVEARANDALGRDAESLVLEVGDVRLSLLGRSLGVTDVLLRPRRGDGAGAGEPAPAEPAGGGRGDDAAASIAGEPVRAESRGPRLHIDSVRVEDLAWTRLVLRRQLRAEAIHMVRPRLQIALGEEADGETGASGEAGTSGEAEAPGQGKAAANGGERAPEGEAGGDDAGTEAEADTFPGAAPFPAAVAGAFPGLRVGTVEVHDGTVVLLGRADEGGRRDVFLFRGIRGVVSDLRMDSTAARDPSRLAFGRPGRFVLDEFWRETADGLTRLVVGPVRFDPEDGRLTAEGLRLAPPMDDGAFLRRLRWRRERVRLSVDRITARGADLAVFLRRGDLVGRALELEGFDVDVFAHRGLPKKPDPPDPGHLPELDGLLRADTVRLTGRAVYAERVDTGEPLARVSFEELRATGYGVTNREGVDPPVVVEARGRVYGTTPVHAVFELRPGPDDFRLSYRGGAGAVDLSAFDAVLVPLEGMKLRAAVDTVAFRVEARGDTATGTVDATYRDLSMEFVDRESGEGTFLGPIKRLLVNLNTNNYPGREGDPPRSGTVAHSLEPDDELLEIAWEALRSGLLSLIRD